MNLKRIHIILIMLGALIIGFGGAYFGLKFQQPSAPESEQSYTNNNFESAGENKEEMSGDMEKVIQAFSLIKKHSLKNVEEKELFEGAIQGMLGTLDDPYSVYMDNETMDHFNETIESSFEGIGAEVSMVNGKVTIIAPIKESPAEEAGLRPNDQILKVDKESVEGLDLFQAVEKIRGEKGSEVVLEIERPGVTDPFDVAIVRDEIPVETVHSESKMVNDKKTGIIEITSFSEKTAEEFKKQLTKLETDGMEGLVIDVRGNPGGLLNVVEDILKLFVPKDIPYVQIEDRDGNKTPYASNLKEKKDYPINVVIDEGSASASEILAVAMKEIGYNIVGTNSFGKGTVQQAVPMGDGSSIKLTFYKWLSPKGNWIHEKGVTPTIEVEQPAYFFANPIQLEETLTFDHTGEKVKNAQIMLEGLGYQPGRVDGYFNQETVSAVKHFQKDNELKATGDIDEKTGGLIETKVVEKIRSGADDKQMDEALNQLY